MPDAHCGRQHAETAPKYVALRRTPGTASAYAAGICTNSLGLLLWRQSAHSMACYPRRCFSVVCLQSFNQAPHTRTLVADVVGQVVVPPLRMIAHPGTALQSDVMHVPRHWRKSGRWTSLPGLCAAHASGYVCFVEIFDDVGSRSGHHRLQVRHAVLDIMDWQESQTIQHSAEMTECIVHLVRSTLQPAQVPAASSRCFELGGRMKHPCVVRPTPNIALTACMAATSKSVTMTFGSAWTFITVKRWSTAPSSSSYAS